jgi:hypothetical protein
MSQVQIGDIQDREQEQENVHLGEDFNGGNDKRKTLVLSITGQEDMIMAITRQFVKVNDHNHSIGSIIMMMKSLSQTSPARSRVPEC